VFCLPRQEGLTEKEQVPQRRRHRRLLRNVVEIDRAGNDEYDRLCG
jgi:hypothetical protein